MRENDHEMITNKYKQYGCFYGHFDPLHAGIFTSNAYENG